MFVAFAHFFFHVAEKIVNKAARKLHTMTDNSPANHYKYKAKLYVDGKNLFPLFETPAAFTGGVFLCNFF